MAKLSTGNIKFMGFAAVGIIAVGGFLLGGQPLLAQVGSSNADIQQAQAQAGKLQTQISDLQKTKAQQAQVDQFRKDFEKAFPSTADVPGLISDISNSAVNAGMSASAITSYGFTAPTTGAAASGGTAPAPAASAAAPATGASGSTTGSGTTGTAPAAGSTAASTGASMATLNVTLAVTGNTNQLARFLKNITSMSRSFTITAFSVSNGANGGSLSVTGTTYLYPHIKTPQEYQNTTVAPSTNGTGTTGTPVPGATPAVGASQVPAAG